MAAKKRSASKLSHGTHAQQVKSENEDKGLGRIIMNRSERENNRNTEHEGINEARRLDESGIVKSGLRTKKSKQKLSEPEHENQISEGRKKVQEKYQLSRQAALGIKQVEKQVLFADFFEHITKLHPALIGINHHVLVSVAKVSNVWRYQKKLREDWIAAFHPDLVQKTDDIDSRKKLMLQESGEIITRWL